MIGVLELELLHVGQVVADAAGRQDVLACHSKVVGTMCFLVRSYAGATTDPQDQAGRSILLHLEEDAHPRVGLD